MLVTTIASSSSPSRRTTYERHADIMSRTARSALPTVIPEASKRDAVSFVG